MSCGTWCVTTQDPALSLSTSDVVEGERSPSRYRTSHSATNGHTVTFELRDAVRCLRCFQPTFLVGKLKLVVMSFLHCPLVIFL